MASDYWSVLGLALAVLGFLALIWRALGKLIIGTGVGCATFAILLSYIASGGDWSVMVAIFRDSFAQESHKSSLPESTPPTKTSIKDESPFASAKFLYDKNSDTMSLLTKENFDVATIDKEVLALRTQVAIAAGSDFIARFVFRDERGPFRVEVTSEQFGPPYERYSVSVVENEKNYIKLKFSPSIGYPLYSLAVMGDKKSAEITIRFYEGNDADRKAEKTTEKDFTKRTVRELRELYEGRTRLQADAFMSDEKGKLIEAEGSVVNIDDGMAFLQVGQDIHNGMVDYVECRFDRSWNAKLGTYRQTERMKIRGVIGPSQNGAQIYLQHCEIIR